MTCLAGFWVRKRSHRSLLCRDRCSKPFQLMYSQGNERLWICMQVRENGQIFFNLITETHISLSCATVSIESHTLQHVRPLQRVDWLQFPSVSARGWPRRDVYCRECVVAIRTNLLLWLRDKHTHTHTHTAGGHVLVGCETAGLSSGSLIQQLVALNLSMRRLTRADQKSLFVWLGRTEPVTIPQPWTRTAGWQKSARG